MGLNKYQKAIVKQIRKNLKSGKTIVMSLPYGCGKTMIVKELNKKK